MTLSDFVRLYALRSTNLSWFFGAGTSVTAGLPSAYDLIWDFKRQIYCSEQGYSIHHYNNLSDPAVRRQIQNYFDGKGDYPKENSVDEYSWYFEKAFPTERGRSEYIARKVSGLQLTFGHKAIGALLRQRFIDIIFTTNFDKAFENVAAREFRDTTNWFCADLDNSETGLKQFQDSKFPLVVKLHGDFRSERLKNTAPELKAQDTNLRHILTISSYTKGLCIMGYSGRDTSVMDALFEALNQNNSFPHGIFWFKKSDTEVMPIVSDFITRAKSKNIEAEIIDIETFDTAWREIINGFIDLPKTEHEKLNENYYRITNRPLPSDGTKLPVIRMNAIEIAKYPAVARVYKCNAGNTKEIRDLVTKNNADLIATRKSLGIVGFGADDQFTKAFSNYGNSTLDLYNISDKTLSFDDSTIKEIITEALIRGIAFNKPLFNIRRRGRYILIPDPKRVTEPFFQEITNELRSITGIIPNTSIPWIVSLEMTIQYKLQKAFLVLTPNILAGKTTNDVQKLSIAPFIKEFTARWYNDKFDRLLNCWLNMIFQNNLEIEVAAFNNLQNGVNASFTLRKPTVHTKLL